MERGHLNSVTLFTGTQGVASAYIYYLLCFIISVINCVSLHKAKASDYNENSDTKGRISVEMITTGSNVRNDILTVCTG